MTYAKLRENLLAPTSVTKTQPPVTCLSTGSILLDKMISVKGKGAIRRGDIVWFHGLSGTCRTFLAHQILAEAAQNSFFDHYRLVYDNPMAVSPISFFGEKYKSRVTNFASTTLEEWLIRLRESACQEQTVSVLDSINALQGDQEKNFQLLNQHIRDIATKIKSSQSILLFISDDAQSFSLDTTRTLRDVPDIVLHFGLSHPPRSTLQYSVVTDVEITVQKRPALSGFLCEHSFPFIPDYGIDDAKACFLRLCASKHITYSERLKYSLPALNMHHFSFDEFVDEFDDIKALIFTLL